jgi:hypothetical protein
VRNERWLKAKLEDFQRDGVSHLGRIFDEESISDVLNAVSRSREFDSSLFLSFEEFVANPEYTGVNPRPGRNFLEAIPEQLRTLESSTELERFLVGLLGPEYQILDRKVVCGLPEVHLPDWIAQRVKGKSVNNLGCFVRPELRDITYFSGIDFHQDLIDWRDRGPNFVTLYIYLENVEASDGPLVLLPKSHFLGASQFPHELELSIGETRTWSYSSAKKSLLCQESVFLGPSGSAAVWHACLLHGTEPVAADNPRLSLRYLIAAKDCNGGMLSQVNAGLLGDLSLHETRTDQSDSGEVVAMNNKLFEHRETE